MENEFNVVSLKMFKTTKTQKCHNRYRKAQYFLVKVDNDLYPK